MSNPSTKNTYMAVGLFGLVAVGTSLLLGNTKGAIEILVVFGILTIDVRNQGYIRTGAVAVLGLVDSIYAYFGHGGLRPALASLIATAVLTVIVGLVNDRRRNNAGQSVAHNVGPARRQSGGYVN